MNNFFPKIVTLIFLSIFSGAFLSANTVEVSIFDIDLDIPLEGVKVIEPKSGYIGYTDEAGVVVVNNETGEQIILLSYLAGYESKKVVVKSGDSKIKIGMSIGLILEGKELVIEGKAPGVNDEQVGVSKVVEKNELKSTAMTGPIQDLMSTVKTLPGVSYAGKFSSNFSVRGGEPNDLTCIMDGFVVRHPWHWGGGFSIFNPNVVDTLKFSAGIFSAKYGAAMSGLMEVNTINPDDGLKFQVVLSTMSVEVLLQAPIVNKTSGIYIGGRITSNDLSFLIAKSTLDNLGLSFPRVPYIYDAYLKWYWKPIDRFMWYINGFAGNDGIKMKSETPGADTDEVINNKFEFNWENYDIFVNTGFKIYPNDRVLIHLLGGYEFFKYAIDGTFIYEGSQEYSSDFKNYYQSLTGAILPDKYKINNTSNFKEYTIEHNVQGRVDIDVNITDKILFSTGLGTTYQKNIFDSFGEFYGITIDNGVPSFEATKYDVANENKVIMSSFAYATFSFNIIAEKLKLEAGMRADHTILIGSDYTLNTYPVPGPRLNIFFTPFKRNAVFENMTFSLGGGLFSKAPSEIVAYKKSFGLKDFDIPIGKAATGVAGVEVLFPFALKVKTEGYFKYQFDRFYINMPADNDNNVNLKIHSDGYGYSTGVDISIERKMSKYADGSLSYSFNYTRMINPSTDNCTETMRGETLGKWFYPTYHRFHTMNFIFNARPASWITITSKFVIASGTPKKTYGDKKMFYAIDKTTGSVLELYTRETFYSDTERSDISIPFDLKIAFNHFVPKTKIYMEYFIGAEDIFSNLYSPKSGTTTNMFSGEDTRASEASFNVGIPLISTGFTINF